MSEFSQYWERTTKQLSADYVDESGTRASCGLIAVKLAELHYKEGRTPHITYLQSSNTISKQQLFESKLVPRPYEGKRVWMYHVICDVNGIVYDPMLIVPTKYDDYAPDAFGEEKLSIVSKKLWTPFSYPPV